VAEVFPRASRSKTRLKFALALAWCSPKRITAADKCRAGLVPRQVVTKSCRDRRVAERRWGELRRTAEKALAAVIQEGYAHGVSTRSVDELVKAMGMSGISKSQVSRLCAEIDERVGAFLNSPARGRPGCSSRGASDARCSWRPRRKQREWRRATPVLRAPSSPKAHQPISEADMPGAPLHALSQNLTGRVECVAQPYEG
jgi:hypothetical protein